MMAPSLLTVLAQIQHLTDSMVQCAVRQEGNICLEVLHTTIFLLLLFLDSFFHLWDFLPKSFKALRLRALLLSRSLLQPNKHGITSQPAPWLAVSYSVSVKRNRTSLEALLKLALTHLYRNNPKFGEDQREGDVWSDDGVKKRTCVPRVED